MGEEVSVVANDGGAVALVTGAGSGGGLAGFTPEGDESGREGIFYHRRGRR